jgi:2-oxoglutarate ferredoxin oxidoreductase subunit alpha
VADLPRLRPRFATADDVPEEEQFRPYSRNPGTLARPWAVPGTPGLAHRIGGLEKADGTGEISYDPDNHDRMVRLRQAKVDGVDVPDLQVDDPWADGSHGSEGADLLVLGWGSTFGPISAAVRAARAAGLRVAQAHLRHLNPFPADTGDVLRAYPRVLVPEMNLGQLALLLRGRYLVDVMSHTMVRGLPFTSGDLEQAIRDAVHHAPPPVRRFDRRPNGTNGTPVTRVSEGSPA